MLVLLKSKSKTKMMVLVVMICLLKPKTVARVVNFVFVAQTNLTIVGFLVWFLVFLLSLLLVLYEVVI